MKRRRDSLVLAGLIAGLLAVTVLAAVQQARQSQTPARLAPDSSAPDGARALVLWLQALGFTVNTDPPPATFAIPVGTDLLFLFEPTVTITPEEWEILDAWVMQGGTLVLVGDRSGTARAFSHYDADLNFRERLITTAAPATAFWVTPPLTTTVEVRARADVYVERERVAPLLTSGEAALLLTFTQGQGRVFLGAIPFSFSNAGLRGEGNPELVLNVLAHVPHAGVIWFDEWHRGQRSRVAAPQGPADWLRFTPSGRAVLYATAVAFLVVLLQGRAFGRPVSLPRALHRRGTLEHVTAMAQLSRRAGHRAAELRYYHDALKRHLARRYRLDPTLPDADYVRQLAACDANLDASALLHLLAQLRRADLDEATLVRLAREVAQWMAV